MQVTFFGGVHGVGKTSICRAIAESSGAEMFTASELIKARRPEAISSSSKLVADVPANQRLLVLAYWEAREASTANSMLLDGHFALRDTRGGIVAVDVEVFRALKLSKLVCVIDDADRVSRRLDERDSSRTSVAEVAALQAAEMAQAQVVARELNLPLEFMNAASQIRSVGPV